jgi:hypothetical protein
MRAEGLRFMHSNFYHVYQTLRVTPAMEAGISEHIWSIEEVIALPDRPEARGLVGLVA